MNINKPILIHLLPIVYCLFYIIFFPERLLNADEISYFNQAITFIGLEEERTFIPANYPLGTSCFYSFFIFLFGIKYVFLGSMLLWLFSFHFLKQICKQLNLPKITLFLFALNIPILFSTTLIMSDLISMFIVIIALSILFSEKIKQKSFLFSLIFSLSIWFRETNIICLLPILIFIIIEEKKIFLILFGLFLGILPRLLSAAYTYETALYLKDPGLGFSLLSLTENIPLIFINLLFLTPLAFKALFKIPKEKVYKILWLGCILHLLFFSLYGYHGGNEFYSSIYLYGRFIIPIVPMVIILIGLEYQKSTILKPSFTKILYTFAIISIGLVAYIRHSLDNKYHQAQFAINNITPSSIILIPKHAEYLKYTNQLVTENSNVLFEYKEKNKAPLSYLFIDRGRKDDNEYYKNINELGVKETTNIEVFNGYNIHIFQTK